MPPDPDKPEMVYSARTEMEAAMIVAALRGAGIESHAQGVLTSALRAEAPGDVGILVRARDLERARAVVSEYRG